MLRKNGKTGENAAVILDKQSVAFKNELLFQNGINFNELPAWQRGGTGLYWEKYDKPGYNPIEGKEVVAVRRRLKVDEDLPVKDEYKEFINQFLNVGD